MNDQRPLARPRRCRCTPAARRALLPLAGLLALGVASATPAARADGYVVERLVRYPARYLLTVPPAPAPARAPTVIEVPAELVTPLAPPAPPAPVLVQARDPYDTDGIVVAGGGFGGLLLRADGRTALAPAYQLHLGLAVGAAEFAVRLNLAPGAMSLPDSGREVSLYATRASFDYRFLGRAVVHPVAGIGLASLVAVPDGGEAGHAFAAVGRLGLELAFPLAHAALALGLDVSGHLPFARSDGFALPLDALLGFGAYLDYRF